MPSTFWAEKNWSAMSPMMNGAAIAPRDWALLLFLWVGSGALRRVRGRSSQVKGACGVAARVRFAPP
jgi:hypothetical protein